MNLRIVDWQELALVLIGRQSLLGGFWYSANYKSIVLQFPFEKDPLIPAAYSVFLNRTSLVDLDV